MKTSKLEKITKAIEADKDLMKQINKAKYYEVEQFIKNAERYIKAIKDRRMICSIGSVSSSGMSRTMKFVAPERNQYSKDWQYLNFFQFFKVLGFTESRNKEHYFTIGGCGMDMVFHTNYTIIHRLYRLGFITKKECKKLEQQTPQVV